MATGNVVVNGSLWITQGTDGANELINKEVAKVLNTSGYPHTKVAFSCSVLLDNNKIMSIGGVRRGPVQKNETHILALNSLQWTYGPVLNQGRNRHGCGRVKIGGKVYVFVTGGYKGVRSVEYLDIEDLNGNWKIGKNYFQKQFLTMRYISLIHEKLNSNHKDVNLNQ